MRTRIFGHARVSSTDQNLDRQIQALTDYGINERDIITDKVSGKDFNRQGYIALKKSDLEKALISNIVFELLAYTAEKERRKIKTRQEEGITAAKGRGVRFGRPGATTPAGFDAEYAKKIPQCIVLIFLP